MEIIRRDFYKSKNTNEKMIEENIVRIKCDCGKIFETMEKITIQIKPEMKIEQEINFKYCPYCAKKIYLRS